MELHNLPFAKQVHATVESGNRRGPSLWLGRTPAILRMLQFPDLPLRITSGIFFKVLTGKGGEREGIAPSQLAKLPELLDEPAAIFQSATVEKALVVLTTAKVASGLVIASIDQGCQDGNATVNLITSVYAKDREAWVAEQVDAGRLLYVDKTKGFNTLEVSGHTLDRVTEPGSQSPSERSILLPEDLCKFREAARSRAFS